MIHSRISKPSSNANIWGEKKENIEMGAITVLSCKSHNLILIKTFYNVQSSTAPGNLAWFSSSSWIRLHQYLVEEKSMYFYSLVRNCFHFLQEIVRT